jgi:hypothetical protein
MLVFFFSSSLARWALALVSFGPIFGMATKLSLFARAVRSGKCWSYMRCSAALLTFIRGPSAVCSDVWSAGSRYGSARSITWAEIAVPGL